MLNITNKSLLEHLGVDEKEIQRRLHFFDISEHDVGQLRDTASVFQHRISSIVEEFYKRQVENDVIASIIGDIDTLKRLHVVMEDYIRTLFKAEYSKEYVNSRLRIGKIHKRIGVTPRLFTESQKVLRVLIENELKILSLDSDYVIESFHKALVFDTELIFESYVDSFISDAENAQQEVEKFASHMGVSVNQINTNLNAFYSKDSLTGLFNRHHFYEYLERECMHARRYKLPLVLVYFDLNNFKMVNDKFGHLAGDEVLQMVGKNVLEVVRGVDIPARYGGDEFCIIMPRTTLEGAERPLSELKKKFSKECDHAVTFSMGTVQTGPESVLNPDDLIRKADKAMYVAKSRAHKHAEHQAEYLLCNA